MFASAAQLFSRSGTRCAIALALCLALAPSACSFLVDDAPYACGPETSCASGYKNPGQGRSCDDAADCPASAPACYAGKCYACTPHRLCNDNTSLCVEAQDGSSAACTPLLDSSLECSFTYPSDLASLAGSDVFAVGLIAQWPTQGNASAYGVPTTQAVELAITSINAERGVPIRNQPARKLLAIACNEAASGTDGRPVLARRVEHLVNKLRVPAIIGGSTSGATRLINATYLDGYDTLLLSPSATDDTLSDHWRRGAAGADQQLFWRTVAPDALQVPALKSVLEVVRTTLRKADPNGRFEIVSVYDTQNSASTNLQDLFSQERNYLADSQPYTSGDRPSKDAVVDAIVERAPRFIVPFGIGEFITFKSGDDPMVSMLENVETAWTDSAARPWYILSEGNRTSFKSALALRPDLSDRVIGTAPGPRSSRLYNSFRNAFEAYFRNRPNTLDGSQSSPGNLAESGYDAAFLLAYAATKASRDGAWPSGSELAKALAELNCKDQPGKLEADKLRYGGHVDALAAAPDGCFDFEGASGPLDFGDSTQSGRSPKSQEPSSDIALWCLGRPDDATDQTANLTHHYFEQSTRMIVPAEGSAPLSVSSSGWCAAATR